MIWYDINGMFGSWVLEAQIYLKIKHDKISYNKYSLLFETIA